MVLANKKDCLSNSKQKMKKTAEDDIRNITVDNPEICISPDLSYMPQWSYKKHKENSFTYFQSYSGYIYIHVEIFPYIFGWFGYEGSISNRERSIYQKWQE